MPTDEKSARKKKSASVSQSDFPAHKLEDSLAVAKAIYDNYAGGPVAPHNVAIAMQMNPTGTQWRMISSASLAYGLITGGWNAEQISITPLGKAIIAPTSEGADIEARKKAVLTPRIIGDFFKKYDRNKLPKDNILENILVESGIPRERASTYRELLIESGKYCGIIKETSSGGFVALELGAMPPAPIEWSEKNVDAIQEELPAELRGIVETPTPVRTNEVPTWDMPVSSVFISHGRNQRILDQVKQIVTFGKFISIISKEKETVSKPVPDKVMDDMRLCQAAVIHVASEGALIDQDGNPAHRINENVLIEIGAAMALYRRRFILLVEDGLSLPSNLQGLYEVRYKGEALDGDATMKLLKAFNDFSSN